MQRPVSPGRLQILGVVFVCVVAGVVIYTHQLVIPLFLGLLTWGKAWIKSLTPKLGLMLVKNGMVIQLRRLLMQASTHILVKSHRPWRRLMMTVKVVAVETLKNSFARYLQMPLWMRTTIAIVVLTATAGSSFAVFALLIIPQPVLIWLRQRLTATLNKLGASKMFSAIWHYLVPSTLRHRWHMHVKWTLGRRQVSAAKQLHQSVLRTAIARGKQTNIDGLTVLPKDNSPPSGKINEDT